MTSDTDRAQGAGAIPAAVSVPTPLLDNPDEDRRRIRHLMPGLMDQLSRRMQTDAQLVPLLHFGQPHKVVRLTPEVAGSADQWFFIGDIHGDFFALHSLLRHAERMRPDCRILFLGDMVDRGDHPLECVFLLLEWGLQRPGRLAWIAGNHDVAFNLLKAGREFTSSVSPAEFLMVLNEDDAFQGYRHRLGRFFIEFGSRLPRALLFPDGLLATHGGFPLADLQAQGALIEDEQTYIAWLNSDACLKDFTWTRIHRAPKKLPDRYSTGAEYGFKDFEAFCALKPQWFPVKRMITGHVHPADGFALHASYKMNPALTLRGFGFEELRAMPGAYLHYVDTLHIAQGVPEQLPMVTEVPVSRGELAMMYSGLDLLPVSPSLSPVVPIAPAEPASVASSAKTSKER